MNCDLFEIFSKRHSFYEINNVLPISKNDLKTLIEKALTLYPSPFNSQSARLILLYEDKHMQFWDIVKMQLLKHAPKEKAIAIQNKIATFAAGAGTILYFMDTEIIRQQEKDFPLYAVNFKNWGYQCNAILQFMIWSAFANQHIGASLQHYNPLIDKEVKHTFNIPQTWELVAQMPFGGIINTPPAHIVSDLDNKFIVME